MPCHQIVTRAMEIWQKICLLFPVTSTAGWRGKTSLGDETMKIDQLVPQKTIQTDPKASKSSKPEQAFGEFLSQELQSSKSVPAEQARELQGPDAELVSAAVPPPMGAAAERFAADLENALDQWADIGDLVASSNASPKEIQSRMESLLDSSQALQKRFEALPDDHPLKQIADELNVLSYVESVKWQRGDYL